MGIDTKEMHLRLVSADANGIILKCTAPLNSFGFVLHHIRQGAIVKNSIDRLYLPSLPMVPSILMKVTCDSPPTGYVMGLDSPLHYTVYWDVRHWHKGDSVALFFSDTHLQEIDVLF
jgi:hypothetical protein